MQTFWNHLHQPDAILMLIIIVLCFAAYLYPGVKEYRTNRASGFWWIVYLIVGILAFIEWAILVFFS